MLAVAVTNETENQTGRVLFFFPYLGLCSISGNLCFCSNTKANPSSRSNASDHQSLNCLHIRNLLCLKEDLLDRIYFTGMSKVCFCWISRCFVLWVDIFTWGIPSRQPGLHSRAGHTGPHSPSQCASHVSLVCQPVSGVLQYQLSVSTVSRSPELSETETDCWVIFPSSPGSQWMPDSQNR